MNKKEIIRSIRSWIVLAITTILSIVAIILAFTCVEVINNSSDYSISIRIGALTLLIIDFMSVKVLFHVANKYM